MAAINRASSSDATGFISGKSVSLRRATMAEMFRARTLTV